MKKSAYKAKKSLMKDAVKAASADRGYVKLMSLVERGLSK